MSEDLEQETKKCKGCKFNIDCKKLFAHLNHPTLKCKEAYSDEEYSSVYDLWMKSKTGPTPLRENESKCNGCKYKMDKYDLIFHLNDHRIECKKAYSKEEYDQVFQYWFNHRADE